MLLGILASQRHRPEELERLNGNILKAPDGEGQLPPSHPVHWLSCFLGILLSKSVLASGSRSADSKSHQLVLGFAELGEA